MKDRKKLTESIGGYMKVDRKEALTNCAEDIKRLAVHFSSAVEKGPTSDMWETPQALFDEWNEKLGPFELDAAATHDNAKTPFYMTEEGTFQRYPSGPFLKYGTDGLTSNWSWCSKVWLNPPYSHIYPWLEKATQEARKGCMIAVLLNADHTTQWYKDFIYSYETHSYYPGVTVYKVPRRVKFIAPPGLVSKRTGKPVKQTTNAFPSIIVVFGEGAR